jgi:pyruvate dehydrogenase (quinone)
VPVLVEAILDPFEPPMPPKATFEQARNFAESLPKSGRVAAGSPLQFYPTRWVSS